MVITWWRGNKKPLSTLAPIYARKPYSSINDRKYLHIPSRRLLLRARMFWIESLKRKWHKNKSKLSRKIGVTNGILKLILIWLKISEIWISQTIAYFQYFDVHIANLLEFLNTFQHNFSVKTQWEKIAHQIILRRATRKICQITTRQNQARILVLILRCEVQNCYRKCQLKKFHCQRIKSTAACSVAFQLHPGVAKESMDTK